MVRNVLGKRTGTNTTGGRKMDLDDLVPSESKYMAKEDVGTAGRNLTIDKFTREEVGDAKDVKTILNFKEADAKPMVLNVGNKNRSKHYLAATNAEEVIGQVVNVYNDPDVEYKGKITGGTRIRGVQNPQPASTAAGGVDPLDDDIPF